ncbi:MAG: 30S ribosome-binding factor RbfA [Bacteroidales bacterium]
MEGDSKRQLKVGRELQRHLAEIIRAKGMGTFSGAMVSVTEVSISSDLSVAKVFLSVFPSEKKEIVMERIQDISKQLRGELGRKVAKQLRIVPELVFRLDESLDYVEYIDELLKKS